MQERIQRVILNLTGETYRNMELNACSVFKYTLSRYFFLFGFGVFCCWFCFVLGLLGVSGLICFFPPKLVLSVKHLGLLLTLVKHLLSHIWGRPRPHLGCDPHPASSDPCKRPHLTKAPVQPTFVNAYFMESLWKVVQSASLSALLSEV